MPRRARKQSLKPEDEFPVTVRLRDERHDRALEKLETWFGADDFSQNAAARIGVESRVLRDLISFGFVRVQDGRCRLKIDFGNLTNSHEIPVPFYRFDSAFVAKYGNRKRSKAIQSRAFGPASEKFFAESNPPSSYRRFKDEESMQYVKRLRWPKPVYDLLVERYGNLSAYIRYLVYVDLGLKEEAERELARMKPRV